MIGFHKKRWYSKTYRRSFIHTTWLETLGENVLEGIARNNPKAFEAGIAIIKHLRDNQKFYQIELDKQRGLE